MGEQQVEASRSMIAASTVAAAHRRDHSHEADGNCHPHWVEVIGLGRMAVTVCHDCRADSGYLDERAAEHLAAAHRRQTLLDDALLSAPPAA
jgi:sulfur relay (sulfurtransferase) complex TusBCD TusD component (DsrE family)